MAEKKLIGQVSPEQINEWKAKHGKVYEIEADGHIGYVKQPGRMEMSHAGTIGAGDNILFNEVLLNDCWLGGSDALKKEDRLFFGVSNILDKIIDVAKATVKNL